MNDYKTSPESPNKSDLSTAVIGKEESTTFEIFQTPPNVNEVRLCKEYSRVAAQ